MAPSDAELVGRAMAGDVLAAGAIYDRYVPLVRATLWSAGGSVAESSDLVQDVFVLALTRLHQLKQPQRLAGWLLEIARRRGIDHRRQMARHRQRVGPLVEEPVAPDAQDDEAEAAMWQALQELPERERLALQIHYLCGEPAEVARQALRLSPAGFYKMLERARQRLRVVLLKSEERR